MANTSAFKVVVNNGVLVPGTDRAFNSYNQPSVNASGLVVFRARSQGGKGGGEPDTGIFTRQISRLPSPIVINAVALRDSLAPNPNNASSTYNEFPSFPRIDQSSSFLAFRGQSQPVWNVLDSTGAIVEKAGTAGIYGTPSGSLTTAMTQLGAIQEFSYFSVPNTVAGTKFDQFPGAPSPTSAIQLRFTRFGLQLVRQSWTVFKGNWTDVSDPLNPISRTGVYFRDVLANGGMAPVQLIADSKTLIPGTSTPFGSTAPPSAAGNKAVFLGLDNEESPTLGGIYLSNLTSKPTNIKPIVELGDLAMLVKDPNGLTRIGEGLSFSSKPQWIFGSRDTVGYWGSWGTETFTQTVAIPSDGRKELRNYALLLDDQQDDGVVNNSADGLFQFEVPVHQGMFLTNVNSGVTRLVAQTGDADGNGTVDADEFSTFLYWNFSGKVPGSTDEEDGEFARWRSAQFIAVDGQQVAFKATRGPGVDSVTGLYAQRANNAPIRTVVETGMNGTLLDPEAIVPGTNIPIPITSVGLERDGFRGNLLAFNASMANESASWAGIYAIESNQIPITV